MIQAKCKKCKYYAKVTMTCDYLLRTGVRRGCPTKKCTRFEPVKKANRAKKESTEPASSMDLYVSEITSNQNTDTFSLRGSAQKVNREAQ